MDLFIEAPPRAGAQGSWRREDEKPIDPGTTSAFRGRRRVDKEDANAPKIPYSQAQDTYREEMAYDKRRHERRKRGAVIRVLLYIVFIPILLIVVFLAAYALTCILNGASPEELAELMGNLIMRMEGFATDSLQMIRK